MAGPSCVRRWAMAATHVTDRADLTEALTFASTAPVRDWDWIDRLLDDWLTVVRGT